MVRDCMMMMMMVVTRLSATIRVWVSVMIHVSIVIIKNGCVFIVDLVMIHFKGK